MSERFCKGELIEYESVYDKKRDSVVYPGQKAIVRGVYVRQLDDRYSDVLDAGSPRPRIIRTERLRRVGAA
jgi:hypothetical protein